MGGTFSRNEAANPNTAINLDYLTTNQHHQSIIRSLYSTNQHTLAHPGAFIINEGAEPQDVNISIKKTRPIVSLFYIDKASCKLVPSTEEMGAFEITFNFTCKTDTKMTFYVLAKDDFDSAYITKEVISSKQYDNAECCHFEKGSKLKFLSNFKLKTEDYTQEQLCTFNETNYPMILVMEPLESDGPERQKFFVYFTFVAIGDSYTLKVVRQKLQVREKAFILDDIYGYGESGLASDPTTDTKECAICLSEKIDTIVLPCKHMCLCYPCAKDLKKRLNQRCPMCRRTVTSFLKYEPRASSSRKL